MNHIKQLNRKLHMVMNNKGTTMLETVVSFLVLMIILGALYSTVRFSSELSMRAVDTGNISNEFNSLVYKSSFSSSDHILKYDYYGQYDPSTTGKYTAFFLKLDTTETNVELNCGRPVAAVDPNDPNSTEDVLLTPLRTPNIDATAFVCSDPIIEEEQLVTPKLITFKYHKP